MTRLRSDDTGAAAVEFALVMLPLLLLLMGIIDFGRTYNAQVSVSAAAREGARVMAISNDPAAARKAVQQSAALNPGIGSGQISFSPTTCSSGATVTVTVSYPMTSVTGFFTGMMTGKNVHGTATMKCNG